MAWLPALIALAGSIYGSSKAKQSAKDLKNQQQPLVDQQLSSLKLLQPYGQQLMGQGQQNMSSVSNLLNGQINSRGSAMEANAPLINQMAGAQQGSIQAQRGLFPRGGQTASQAANQPYQLQGNVNNVLFGARQNAIGQLGQLGGNQSSLGLGALGQGAGLTNNMLNYGLNAQQQMFGQGAMIGQGISSLMGPLMQYYMMNRSAPSTNSSTLSALPSSGYYGAGGIWGDLYGSGQRLPDGSSRGSLLAPGNAYTTYSPTPGPGERGGG